VNYTATTIGTDGETSSRTFAEEPPLEFLRAAIGGGFIEAIHRGGLFTVYADEDGTRKRLAANERASAMLHQLIVGSIVIVYQAEAPSSADH
jgi:hypothetical protein